jgi:hypothetical protein
MTSFATLSLSDSVPVAHSFAPVQNIDGVAKYADRAGGIALGYPVVTLSVRQPTSGSRTFKIQAKVVTPVLEVTSPSTSSGIQPAPTKAYDLIANVEFVLPERAALLERKNLQAYVKNLLAHATFTAAVENLEAVY